MACIDDAIRQLKSVKGVLSVHELTEAQLIQVRRLEEIAQKNGAANGLMEFKNQGVWDSVSKDHVVLVVADTEQGFRDPPESWTLMVDKKGNVIGEWIRESEIEEYKQKENVQFIGNDFVMYTDRARCGECMFMMPSMPFPELDDVSCARNVRSGCVSPPGDMYLKKEFGIEGNFWTLLVGFNESRD